VRASSGWRTKAAGSPQVGPDEIENAPDEIENAPEAQLTRPKARDSRFSAPELRVPGLQVAVCGPCSSRDPPARSRDPPRQFSRPPSAVLESLLGGSREPSAQFSRAPSAVLETPFGGSLGLPFGSEDPPRGFSRPKSRTIGLPRAWCSRCPRSSRRRCACDRPSAAPPFEVLSRCCPLARPGLRPQVRARPGLRPQARRSGHA
jgi:hypothetical protein